MEKKLKSRIQFCISCQNDAIDNMKHINSSWKLGVSDWLMEEILIRLEQDIQDVFCERFP